jgi:hypothetical protein
MIAQYLGKGHKEHEGLLRKRRRKREKKYVRTISILSSFISKSFVTFVFFVVNSGLSISLPTEITWKKKLTLLSKNRVWGCRSA